MEQVKEAELLGVTLDLKLSWSTHLNKIVSKMSRGIFIIRASAYFMMQELNNLVIQSLVLCHLDYCPGVCSGALIKDLQTLQVTQQSC